MESIMKSVPVYILDYFFYNLRAAISTFVS